MRAYTHVRTGNNVIIAPIWCRESGIEKKKKTSPFNQAHCVCGFARFSGNASERIEYSVGTKGAAARKSWISKREEKNVCVCLSLWAYIEKRHREDEGWKRSSHTHTHLDETSRIFTLLAWWIMCSHFYSLRVGQFIQSVKMVYMYINVTRARRRAKGLSNEHLAAGTLGPLYSR